MHTAQPPNVLDDANISLNVSTRDAFVMIEIGEQIPTTCVTKIQQIPVSTVLESTSGEIQFATTS